MTVVRRLLLLALVTLFLIVMGALDGVPRNASWADLPPPVAYAIQGLLTALGWAVRHPRGALIVLVLVVGPILLGRLVALIPRAVQTDPVRMFTVDQRRSGFDLAGGRCEMEGVFFTRCRAAAAHGDHWFPWSKGGPTSMENFVAACATHNTAKGAKVPTFWQTQRLAARRRKYFPADRLYAITPGGKYQIPT